MRKVPVRSWRPSPKVLRRTFGRFCVCAAVVVRVRAERGDKTVGLAVDGVSDVHDFAADDIRPPPQVPSSPGRQPRSRISRP